MTDVTQQLADALRELLVAVHYADPPKNYGTEDEPNICHEARIPVGFVEPAHRALTAFEASRAAPDDVVERVAKAIHRADRKRSALAWDFAEMTTQADHLDPRDRDEYRDQARAALAALPARDEAALADLALDYLHLAQPEFCSTRCPSVGREGVPIPHLPECVSMRSLLDGLPFATPGATISTGLMAKLKKLANYLTEQGEYEACDLIDTVVDRLSGSSPTPAPEFGPLDPASQNLGTWEPGARDEGLEALRELSERATRGPWRTNSMTTFGQDWPIGTVMDCGTADEKHRSLVTTDGLRGGVLGESSAETDAALIAAAVNYVRKLLAQEPRS